MPLIILVECKLAGFDVLTYVSTLRRYPRHGAVPSDASAVGNSASQRLRRMSLPALEFLARFLQHVLPRGLAKVRYYGIFSGTHRALLKQARALLSRPAPRTPPACSAAPSACSAKQPAPAPAGLACPHCHTGRLRIIEVLPAHSRSPP